MLFFLFLPFMKNKLNIYFIFKQEPLVPNDDVDL